MNKQRMWVFRTVIVVLSVVLLSGCGASTSEGTSSVRTGETIASDSKWINSDIQGAIDGSTPTNVKDDFYTAVNRDWLLATTATEENPNTSNFTQNEKILRERKLAIVRQGQEATVSTGTQNPTGLTAEQLIHNQELVATFASLAGDWESRNTEGVNPARPYLEAIESINSLDDMTAYLLDDSGMNFTQKFLVDIRVEQPFNDRDINTVMIDTKVPLSLKKQDEYSNITLDGLRYKEYTNQKITYLLERLGYEAGDIQRVLTQCYNFEGRLSAGMKTSAEQNTIDYLSTADNTYTMDQMREIEGAYPLTQILSREQLDTSMRYTVTEPEYVKNVGKLYNESNLEEIKSYYLVHTLVELMPLLDRESYDKYTEIETLINGNATKEKSDPDMDQDGSGNANQSEADKETEILLDGFIGVYLAEPMDEIYIAQYCKAEDKADIEGLIDDAIAYYREMLQGEDWLSEETRNKAVEKLDNLTIRAVYPDTVTDYTGLQFAQGGSLADAVAATKRFKSTQMKNKVNQAINSSEWDMNEMSTTVSNAYYKPLDNSINILAGILADGFFYNREAAHEERLARIGTIIGHEITHAFDTQGSQFDKDGRAVNWWTNDDTTAFMARTTKLTQFYGALTPYPGALSYGASVSGEAIADMGGVKCMLGLASKKADFDYQVFFKAYGELWRQKNTYAVEEAIAEDVHPLAFLRVNVTLQQFDAFNEAFGIRSGDGMYVAPENRIMVW